MCYFLSFLPRAAQGGIELGRIASMEKEHKAVDVAKRGDAIAMKIEVRAVGGGGV